jgi:tetratricopeptide (TPR) repeat protein
MGQQVVRRVAAIAAACGLFCSCPLLPAPAATPASTSAPTAADFEAAIAGLDKFQPNSPATLAARLDYAEYLLDSASGPCGQRLQLAQSQVDSVNGHPVTQVIFPDGWDRAADLQYQILRARASCDADPAARTRELQSGLEAAQRAVQLYRDALDYRSMAVMQYNVADTARALGDNPAALAALESAIAQDREFGLRADAQDNYATLLKWRQGPAGPQDVARLMADFPDRSVMLKFAWSAADATMSLDMAHAAVVDGTVIRARDPFIYERIIRAGDNGWIVTCIPAAGQSDPGPWSRNTADPSGPAGIFRPTLLQFPTLEVTSAGDFKGADELVAFAARVTHDAQEAIRTRAPTGARSAPLLNQALFTAQIEFAPAVIANEVSETYGLETAMWIGATLKQGVSYELTVPLSLPGIAHVIVEHRLQFSFTREVPCTAAPAAPRCVELVLRATPLEQPLNEVLAGFQLPQGVALHYASSISMRLLLDPQTLNPYLRDTHRYWYVTVGKRSPNDVLMESDHSEFKFTYR